MPSSLLQWCCPLRRGPQRCGCPGRWGPFPRRPRCDFFVFCGVQDQIVIRAPCSICLEFISVGSLVFTADLVLSQMWMSGLVETWMTTHKQYGGMLCFFLLFYHVWSFVPQITDEWLNTLPLLRIYWMKLVPFHRFMVFEDSRFQDNFLFRQSGSSLDSAGLSQLHPVLSMDFGRVLHLFADIRKHRGQVAQ